MPGIAYSNLSSTQWQNYYYNLLINEKRGPERTNDLAVAAKLVTEGGRT